MSRKTTIGITGGIGSGKSVVSRVLRCNGLVVYDCDSEAKIIMVKDKFVKESLIKKLGKDIYTSSGELNRGKLANIIFTDSALRTYVNSIVHEAVRKDIEEKRKRHEGKFFIESAILASSGLVTMCNTVWLVTAPLEERINRVMKRDKSEFASVMQRVSSQEKEMESLPDEKVVIIDNDCHSALLPEIFKLINKQIHNTYTNHYHVERNFSNNG